MATAVKICGLSTPASMKAALDAGADYVGLVFHRPSPRHVEFEAARHLADLARGRARSVAVVVDASPGDIERISAEVRPDYIQAHGSETPNEVSSISTRTGIPVIKAIAVGDVADFDRARASPRDASPDGGYLRVVYGRGVEAFFNGLAAYAKQLARIARRNVDAACSGKQSRSLFFGRLHEKGRISRLGIDLVNSPFIARADERSSVLI